MTLTNSSKQEFEDTKDPTESNNQINKTWINIAKGRGKWALPEEAYTMTVIFFLRDDGYERCSSSAIPHRKHQQLMHLETAANRHSITS